MSAFARPSCSRRAACDYNGSSHFFFDIGNAHLLAFFDFKAWIWGSTPRCWAHGARLERIADQLGEMYGTKVL